MRVTALSRGGLAVYGGFYDPHADEAVVLIRDGETVSLAVDFPAAALAPSVEGSGVTASAPVASGRQVTTTLSALQDGGYVDLVASVDGATRRIRVRAASQTGVDRYSS